mmetsp:Transcript_48611/g.121378  ORF Transcript_48611/g.121378 Transcript_48611/m.121378 type:complete len:368 (-) Transcript_48611:747-1850(-)
MPNFSYLCAYSTGYMTVSISSCLTFSRPPTSAQVTSGISTLVSLSDEGLVLAMAANMSFCRTLIFLICDMGSSSSSRSRRSVWSRMHCTPASRTSCARSPPVYPWASWEMPLRSTSSASCMFLVLILRISCLPLSSGETTSISLLKRPKRRSDWSMSLGLLVAATTMTFSLIPSIRVMSCDTMRFSTSPLALSLLPAMTSTSSIQMTEGAFLVASSKHRRRWFSLSPALPDRTSGPLIRKKKAPHSDARALPIIVFPHPAGPCSSTPRGGEMPTRSKISGCRRGSSTSSRSCEICLERPPTSSYPTSSERAGSSERSRGAPSVYTTVSGATTPYSVSSSSICITLKSMVMSSLSSVMGKVSPTWRGR